jgi:hypothetical protein
MKKLKLDIENIIYEMENQSYLMERYSYLDTHTGEVVSADSDIFGIVEEDATDEMNELPDWQKDELEIAKNILKDTIDRYIEIPKIESFESYRHMEKFVETLDNSELKEKLYIALDGKGAFRRFKNVLEHYPEERERWFKFKHELMVCEVRRWLEAYDINF